MFTTMTNIFNPSAHLIQLKSKEGPKDYLPVQCRLVWFREQCPDGVIETELVHFDPDEQHSVSSGTGARMLLFLAPWPGQGHYRDV